MYSDCAMGQTVQGSTLTRSKNCFFSETSIAAQKPTHPPIQRVLGLYPGGKAVGA
jgi:hypothetical protein